VNTDGGGESVAAIYVDLNIVDSRKLEPGITVPALVLLELLSRKLDHRKGSNRHVDLLLNDISAFSIDERFPHVFPTPEILVRAAEIDIECARLTEDVVAGLGAASIRERYAGLLRRFAETKQTLGAMFSRVAQYIQAPIPGTSKPPSGDIKRDLSLYFGSFQDVLVETFLSDERVLRATGFSRANHLCFINSFAYRNAMMLLGETPGKNDFIDLLYTLYVGDNCTLLSRDSRLVSTIEWASSH